MIKKLISLFLTVCSFSSAFAQASANDDCSKVAVMPVGSSYTMVAYSDSMPIQDLGIARSTETLRDTKSLNSLFSIEIEISDSSEVPEGILSIDAIDYLSPDTGHVMILGRFGEPIVHIYAEGDLGNVVLNRFRHAQWWESQSIWTLSSAENDPTPVMYVFSEDLENFYSYEPKDTLDGHAIELTDDGLIVNLIIGVENETSMGLPTIWTEWSIDYQNSESETIPVRDYYTALSTENYVATSGFVGNPSQFYDPLHGNSLDYATANGLIYIGGTNRTPDDLLIVRKEFGLWVPYIHGGPLGQFTGGLETKPFKAHDFRFIEVTDSTALVTFFSNGNGWSPGGEHATGKLVKLNFTDMTAELIHQFSLPGGVNSNAMGSYDVHTRTFSPGLWKEDGETWSRALALTYDSSGNEVRRISRPQGYGHSCYQANIYGPESGALESLLRPTLDVSCSTDGSHIQFLAEKSGQYNSFTFFVNEEQWQGSVSGGNMIELPSSFIGEVTVMSHLEVPAYGAYVDKYSESFHVDENLCPVLLGVDEEQEKPFNYYDGLLIFSETASGVILDESGRVVLQFSDKEITIDKLPRGVYTVYSDAGSGILVR